MITRKIVAGDLKCQGDDKMLIDWWGRGGMEPPYISIRGKSASGAQIGLFLSAFKRLRSPGTKSYGLSRSSRNWHVIKEQPSGWCHVMIWQSFEWCLSGATSWCDTIQHKVRPDRMRNGAKGRRCFTFHLVTRNITLHRWQYCRHWFWTG